MTLMDAIRDYLREHPGASKGDLVRSVKGSAPAISDAFQELVEKGLAIYEPPVRPGQPGKCSLAPEASVRGNGRHAATEPTPNGSVWKPAVACPKCGRPPAIRFTEREVLRARLDTQGAHLVSVQCTRTDPYYCRTVYWIRAEHVAAATLDGGRSRP